MKKLLFTLFLSFVLCIPALAVDDLNDMFIANAKQYNSEKFYETIKTNPELVNSITNVNESMKKNIDTQTKLIKYQAVSQGLDIFDVSDIREQQSKLYEQSRFYLRLAKKEAQYDNDEEVLQIMNQYWKWWSTTGTIIAAKKVRELKEKRANENKNISNLTTIYNSSSY